MSVEMTYKHDVLEPLTAPPKTLAEQQRDALLWAARRVSLLDNDPQPGLSTWCAARSDAGNKLRAAIASVESGKVPS